MYEKAKKLSVRETMERYPKITAHIIAESLGYATPSRAAGILKDAREGRENYYEWIYSCYDKDPLRAVRDSIRARHFHKGCMSDYNLAKKLVDHALESGKEPLLASWF